VYAEGDLVDVLRIGIAAGTPGFVVQPLLRSIEPHDYRILIVDGQVVFAHARSLMSLGDEPPWIASGRLGSETRTIDPPDDVVQLAIEATSCIGAVVNDPDIIRTEEGPIVIENNPTPSYTALGEGRRRAFADGLFCYLARG